MMMGFGFVGMFLVWGVLVALLAGGVVLVLRQTSGSYPPAKQSQRTARQILNERLARGEISRQEYETVRVQIER